MMLFTILQAELSKFISEQEVFRYIVKAVLGFFAAVFAAIGSFVVWSMKTLLTQIKEYKKTKENETEAFKGQFSAINEYINETDKVQMLHTKTIGEIEEKTKSLESKSEKHGRLLAEHGIEIKNLKENNND